MARSKSKARILIVDDEKSIRSALREVLEFQDYTVDEAADGMESVVKVKQRKYDLIILDIKMPKMDGMEALDRIQIVSPETAIIMISGHGSIDTAVEAVKKGAFDFISKPPDLNRLLITVRNALDKTSLVTETKQLKRKVNKSKAPDMIGDSDAMEQIKNNIDRVAPTDARVLITGNNGTGKELVARWIHAKSQRSKRPLVEVNCAAIPAELIESELFGHEKGAFTSAVKQRIGKFEQANEGTLFLDEVGDMSLSAQAKVLRALQEKCISRVGGDKEIQVDVRVIAATNKDLQEEIKNGKFREDLYHRLAVILVRVPDLKDRSEDIPALIDHFNSAICKEYGVNKKKFSQTAVKALQDLEWTGNIRELRNVVERLIILSGKSISIQDVKSNVYPQSAPCSRFKELFSEFDSFDEVEAYMRKEYKDFKSST
ncbi:MAG: response regulator [Bacteroidetes bacterium]|jgi:DNA-binding NtrC family response regulator|nr:response regulator [Bacteroidota bacterium]